MDFSNFKMANKMANKIIQRSGPNAPLYILFSFSASVLFLVYPCFMSLQKNVIN